MATAIASAPTLSSLMAWPTEHLTNAADYWSSTGNRWYDVFAQTWHESLSVDWRGTGADALQTRTYADKLKVSGLVDQLHEAAKVARAGASDLYAARSRVRYAVEDARDAGFAVGEDLSVTDRSTGGSSAARSARQAQAQAFAADIRQRAVQLIGLDEQVATKVNAAMAGVGNVFPADTPTTTTTSPTEPPPQCKPEDIAKLQAKVDDFNRRDKDYLRRVADHNRKPRDYNINDPEQKKAYELYVQEEHELRDEGRRLQNEGAGLYKDLTECGVKIVWDQDHTHAKILWPDGSVTE